MAPGKSLAPWVLFLEQESYLSYINLDYKNLDYKIYTKILKNRMQSVVIRNRTILHTFCTIRDVIDVSRKLNSNLTLISLNFRESLTEQIGISCPF